MTGIFSYDIFLSFASSDEEIVRPIWQELSLSGLRVFWSDESLKENIGQSFFSVIENAIVQSRHFLLFCTQASMNSNWVREEYSAFFSQCYIPSDRKRRMILFPGRNFDVSGLPPLLKNLQIARNLDEIVTLFGGINIQALKAENINLKDRIQSLLDEIERISIENKKLKNINEKLSNKYDLMYGKQSETDIDTKNSSSKKVKNAAAKKTNAKPMKAKLDDDLVFSLIEKNKNGIDIGQLKKETGLESRNLSNILYRLTKQERIKSKSRGVYIKA